LVALNHFTVPIATSNPPSIEKHSNRRAQCEQNKGA
jgi:hypothetical protein